MITYLVQTRCGVIVDVNHGPLPLVTLVTVGIEDEALGFVLDDVDVEVVQRRGAEVVEELQITQTSLL